MKQLIASLFILFVASSSIFAQAWIDPVLKQRIITQSTEKISVIVLLKESDTSSRSAKQSRSNLADSSLDIISRAGIQTTRLSKESILWSVNGLHLILNWEEILNLSRIKEIKSIIYDQEVSLALPIIQPTDENTSSITWGLEMIGASKVWNELKLTGKNVKVGVLDTGYSDHPALKGKIAGSKNFIWGQGAGPNDGHGHGTHCAGTIGGLPVNGKTIGVAPGVNFMIGRIFNNKGKGSLSLMLKGMQWMADPDENPDTNDFPAVVSNSWGVPWANPKKVEPLLRAVQTWRAIGIVPLFAAGNNGPNAHTILKPAAFNESLTVGATDSKDRIARFSSRGPGNYLGISSDKPDLSAPGASVYSSDLHGKYSYKSGTSMATPHVAGVIALMLEANPGLSVDEIQEILKSSSLDLGDAGYDYQFGWGRVNAYKAALGALQSLNTQN